MARIIKARSGISMPARTAGKTGRVDGRISQRNPRGKLFADIGRSGLRYSYGYVREEFIDELRQYRAVQTYKEMRDNDPIIGASMQAIEQTIRRVNWYVEAPKMSDGQMSMRSADFLQSCMHDMTCTWDEMMSEVVSFLTYGWSWLEMTMKVRGGESRNDKLNSRYNDGKIGFKRISLRMQQSLYRWVFDEMGMLTGMEQVASPDYNLRIIPKDKSLLFRVKAEGNNPEGRSVMRNAFRPWYFKKIIEEIEAVGIERDLIGLPIVKGPDGFDIEDEENEGMKAEITTLLASLRRDEQDGIYLPFGWDIDLLGHSGASRRQFDTDKVINRYDKRIATSLLTHAILLGSDRVGSFALGKTHVDDFFKVAVQGYLQTVSAIFNRFMVPYLFRQSSDMKGLISDDKLPRLIPGKISAPTLGEVGEYIKNITDAGFLIEDLDLRASVEAELVRVGEFDEAEPLGGVRVNNSRPQLTKPSKPIQKPTPTPTAAAALNGKNKDMPIDGKQSVPK